TVSTGSSVTDYAGNYIYQGGTLQFFGQSEGYVTPDGNGGYDYVYQYKDHLGNIRLSYVEDDNGDLEIVEENNYYPFGLKHKGYNDIPMSPLGNSVAQKWKYNGVELDETTGLYEMDFRQYDAAIGRFTAIDLVTHHSMSTYTGFDNNPIYWADPSGANAECPSCETEEDWNAYYAQAEYTANITGQKIEFDMVLGDGPLSSAQMDDGHVVFYLNGELQDLNKHDNRLDAFSSLVGDGLMPEAPGRLFKFLGSLLKGGGDEVAEATTKVSDELDLLPGELEVGTYDELINAGTKGDNITPHHMPSANYMKSKGISTGEGVSMNMEQPYPGVGGRHRRTASYGRKSDASISARLSLATDIKDARQIYMQDGLYGGQVRDALQNVVKLNIKKFPNLYKK
ncbi:RHS repeat-associated core domain-containing protein, partial [Flagellimonas abyssi]